MEGLKELEKVQNVIELLHSYGIIDSSIQNPQTQRFLADFTIFLVYLFQCPPTSFSCILLHFTVFLNSENFNFWEFYTSISSLV